MEHVEMVEVGGVRYRRPDAERLGLVAPPAKPTSAKPKAGADTKPRRPTSAK